MKVSKFKGQEGIYKITNTINGKCYIGCTSCFYRRSHHYIYDFYNQRSRQINEYLLRSMNKHGLANFTLNVIEICNKDEVEDRELFWMSYFKSTDRNSGYNLRSDKCGAMIVHDSTRKKISERLKKEWESGIRSDHSDKLKQSWETRDRAAQGKLFTEIKTKYNYVVSAVDSEIILLYKGLVEMKLHGVIGKFAKRKSDKVDFKGFIIERIRVNDS